MANGVGGDGEQARHGGERLRVYHLAVDFARSVDSIVRKGVRNRSLAEQLVRAADSLVLNIAEGASHYSPGRKAYHYQTARGSAGECIAALTRLGSPRHAREVEHALRAANMICVMLTALIVSQEARKAK